MQKKTLIIILIVALISIILGIGGFAYYKVFNKTNNTNNNLENNKEQLEEKDNTIDDLDENETYKQINVYDFYEDYIHNKNVKEFNIEEAKEMVNKYGFSYTGTQQEQFRMAISNLEPVSEKPLTYKYSDIQSKVKELFGKDSNISKTKYYVGSQYVFEYDENIDAFVNTDMWGAGGNTPDREGHVYNAFEIEGNVYVYIYELIYQTYPSGPLTTVNSKDYIYKYNKEDNNYYLDDVIYITE